MSVDSGGLKGENDESEFSHPYFMRGQVKIYSQYLDHHYTASKQEHLLDQIKRKVSTASQRPSGVYLPSIKSEKVKDSSSAGGGMVCMRGVYITCHFHFLLLWHCSPAFPCVF